MKNKKNIVISRIIEILETESFSPMSRYSFALSLKIPNIEPIYKGIFKFKHVKDNIYACAWSKNNDDNYIIGEWNGKWSGTDKIFIGTFINFNNKNKIEGTWVGQWDNDLDENKEFIGIFNESNKKNNGEMNSETIKILNKFNDTKNMEGGNLKKIDILEFYYKQKYLIYKNK